MAALLDIPDDEPPSPLVPAGTSEAGRDRIIDELLDAWARPHPMDPDQPDTGVTLNRVALYDAERKEPIDLGDLLLRLEARLDAAPPLEPGQGRIITLRGCRIGRCSAPGLAIRPQLQSYGCRWGDVDFAGARLGDGTQFEKSSFGDGASFENASFGERASFQGSTFGARARFDGAAFGTAAVFSGTSFGPGATFDRAAFGVAAMFHHVTMAERASFAGASFDDGANFMGSRFGAGASFRDAAFDGTASFGGVSFDEGASFEDARFTGGLFVPNARFGRGASFRGAVTGGLLDLGATFEDGRPFPGMGFSLSGLCRGLLGLSLEAARRAGSAVVRPVRALAAGRVGGAARHDRLEAVITEVARAIRDERVFRERAERAAHDLGPRAVRALGRRLRRPRFQPPPELREEFPQFDDWCWATMLAVLEILRRLGEPALPVLRREAFGAYDWPQAPAAAVLCQLAVDGVQTDRIAREIAAALPTWPIETAGRAIQAVTALAPHAPVVMEAVHAYVETEAEEDPIDALAALEPLAVCAPEAAGRHEVLLRAIMTEHGRGVRNPVLDGFLATVHGGEVVGYSGQAPDDHHAIRAALVLYRVFPDDGEVRAQLRDWAESHPDEPTRRRIREAL